MRLFPLFPALLISACVTTSTESDSEPRASGPPVVAPGSLVNETAPPSAPMVQRERCNSMDDAASGWPARTQAEVGVLGTVPDTFGVPMDIRAYARSGCEPAH